MINFFIGPSFRKPNNIELSKWANEILNDINLSISNAKYIKSNEPKIFNNETDVQMVDINNKELTLKNNYLSCKKSQLTICKRRNVK